MQYWFIVNSETKSLSNLEFDNSYSRLPEGFFRSVRPTALPDPYLVAFSSATADLLGIDVDKFHQKEFIEILTGNRIPEGSNPISAIYAGHQFGVWVPQLGDGRAILLGEVRTRDGRRLDLQLKGAGLTPFSRMGDGRAVLRSTIREFLCSEAMHALGIPTTRALAVTGSKAPVYREKIETAAVLTRVAESHVRFGTFELFASRNQTEEVKILADYVINDHFSELKNEEDKYVLFFREVISRTAKLLARWQAIGWSHGVMNTDNMSIIGLTMDYGPFGFLDEFDPAFICNHSDHSGRYAYHQQPAIGLWNLSVLGQALLSLIKREEAIAALDTYENIFITEYFRLMREKIGLFMQFDEDTELISDLLLMMQQSAVDYAKFFRTFSGFSFESGADNWNIKGMFVDPAAFDAWAMRYIERVNCEPDADRNNRMLSVNPKYILRNHVVQRAIEMAENDDFSEVEKLLDILSQPYSDHPVDEFYENPPKPGTPKLVVSCSS